MQALCYTTNINHTAERDMNTGLNKVFEQDACAKMASTCETREAVRTAYAAQGVKSFTEVGATFISGVQHHAGRTKAIMKDAAGRLERKGLAHTLHIIHAAKGQSLHVITF